MKRIITVTVSAMAFAGLLVNCLSGGAETLSEGNQSILVSSTPVETVTVSVPQTKVEIVTGSYEISSGETLSGISREIFGSFEFVEVIYGQNTNLIETTATQHGFANSESGHWVFPGTSLSISIPVVTTTLVEVETSTQSETPMATSSATATSLPTETIEYTATVSAVATATATVTTEPTSTVTGNPSVTATATETATPTETATATSTSTSTATPTETAVPFVFSPILPLDPQVGITFYISTQFGEWSFNSRHRGIDIATRQKVGGFPIKAVEVGTVTQSGWNGTFGYSVTILHPNNLSTMYAHLNAEPSVEVGQIVEKGFAIGFMGTTGFSTGNHLHFEVLDQNENLLDPRNYLDFSESKMNSIPPPAQPLPAEPANAKEPVAIVFLRNYFPELAKQMDIHNWKIAVTKNDKLFRDQLYFIAELQRQKDKNREDFLIASFFLRPWVQQESYQQWVQRLEFISQLKTYTVQSGDSVSTISKSSGASIEEIIWLNKLNNVGSQWPLSVGVTIVLPPGSTIPPPRIYQVSYQNTSDPLGLGYPVGAQHYVGFMREMATLYGANFDTMFRVINECENGSWNANDYHWDVVSYTGGIGQFKEETYLRIGRRMGLSADLLIGMSWLNPYNQLRVMAYAYANGYAGEWSCYRSLYE